MARPLERLLSLGLVLRELPFGEDERSSKRVLYRIADPFFRLWFRVVAPHRAQLASGTPAVRRQILARYWENLCAQSWEDLCRRQLPLLSSKIFLGQLGPWGPALRWWHGAQAEWDLISESLDGERVLLGEVKWSSRPLDRRALERAFHELAAKPAPPLPARLADAQLIRALFVPEIAGKADVSHQGPKDLALISATDFF
jgi:AAA+ ATPase superfamily predicted ATPase